MNTVLSRVACGCAALALVGLLSGCATEKTARFGEVSKAELAADESTPHFSFTENNGQISTFEDVRGAVSIVAFPEKWSGPTCTQGHRLAELASQIATQSTPVTVISVAPPTENCANVESAFAQCNVKGYAQFLALCDNEARIRDLYGTDANGRFYVMDSEGKVNATGDLNDEVELERAVRAAVRDHEREAARSKHPDAF
ncbi:MAG: redoxin domain-containing protein [Phycisphaerae bacterium]|nr:redoxin domain-containing protein [Phycisphaerae bacterium]